MADETEILAPPVIPIIRTKIGKTIAKKAKEELGRKEEEILKGLQERVFKSSLEVVGDMLEFRSVDPSKEMLADPIFHEWVDEFGDEEARRKYRVASAAWAPAKDAPMAIKEASSLAVGIIKARAVEKGGARVLNVGKVFMAAEIPSLPEREVE